MHLLLGKEQENVEDAVRELADALQTLVLSLQAYYHAPAGCHIRSDGLQPVAHRVLRAAEDITSAVAGLDAKRLSR